MQDRAFLHNLPHISGKTDGIFRKILPKMYLWTRKSLLSFGVIRVRAGFTAADLCAVRVIHRGGCVRSCLNCLYTGARRSATRVRGSIGVAWCRARRDRIRAGRLPSQEQTTRTRTSRTHLRPDVDYVVSSLSSVTASTPC